MTSFSMSREFIREAIGRMEAHYDCNLYHGNHSCEILAISHGINSIRSLFPMYLMVHLTPFLLFKLKKLKNKPAKQIKQFFKGFAMSLLFAGCYSAFTLRLMCFLGGVIGITGSMFKFCTMGAGVALLCQPIGRQSEIALFTVNKSVQTLYNLALRRGLAVRIPYGQCLVMGLSMGVIVYYYYDQKDAIRPSYQSVLDRILKQR